MTTRRTFITRASALAALPLAMAASGAASARSAQDRDESGSKTFVAVHGSWVGGWIWRAVARRLRAAGHEIFTPTLTGLGERVHLNSPEVDLDTHIEDIVNVLHFEDLHGVTLVGHSYGGLVVTGVAERVPERLARIIYLDAYVPRDGQALSDLVPHDLVAAFISQAEDVGDGWRIPYFDPEAERRTDFQLAAGLQPLAVGNPDAAALPKAYIACLESRSNPLYAAFIDAAERAQAEGWDYRELPTGHHPMETMPDELAALLVELA